MGRAPIGFSFATRARAVVISRDGREIATLRGDVAARFLADVASADPQDVMARVTGNYRRGTERAASRHPRNQG